MVKEAYVSFEVAKLLKDKGFLKGVALRITQNLSFYDNIGLTYNLNKWYDSLIQDKINFVVAPTHQMAMAWLREVHKVNIEIHYNRFGENYKYLIIYKPEVLDDIISLGVFYYYEEAVEAALKYSLENLI